MEEVQYKLLYHVKSHADLIIGEDARAFIAEKENRALQNSRLEEFFISVKRYFVVLCDYLVAKLPLQQELLKHVEVADARLQVNTVNTTQSTDFLFFLDTSNCNPCRIDEGLAAGRILPLPVHRQLTVWLQEWSIPGRTSDTKLTTIDASEITCSMKQCRQMTPFCCVGTCGVGRDGTSLGGVNISNASPKYLQLKIFISGTAIIIHQVIQ